MIYAQRLKQQYIRSTKKENDMTDAQLEVYLRRIVSQLKTATTNVEIALPNEKRLTLSVVRVKPNKKAEYENMGPVSQVAEKIRSATGTDDESFFETHEMDGDEVVALFPLYDLIGELEEDLRVIESKPKRSSQIIETG